MSKVSYLIMSTTMTSPALLKQELVESSWDELSSKPAEFFQKLMDYGIETVEQFEESYQGQHRSGALFAEELCQDCGYLGLQSDIPDFILNHIDWETVWSNELRFDYFEVDGHFFRNF